MKGKKTMDKETLREFVKAQRNNQRKVQELAKELCRTILLNDVAGHRVQFFDEEEGNCDMPEEGNCDMPCTNVANNCVSDDVVSANVRAIWLDDENGIHVELSYYYHSGEIEEQFIENDNEFDWLEMLDWLTA